MHTLQQSNTALLNTEQQHPLPMLKTKRLILNRLSWLHIPSKNSTVTERASSYQ